MIIDGDSNRAGVESLTLSRRGGPFFTPMNQ
jgi:hypothetical protein